MIDWTRDFYIHTPYQDQADHVCEILDALGYKWASGDLLPGFTNWKLNKHNMHYHVHHDGMYITFSKLPERGVVYPYEAFIDAYDPDTPISISEFL